MTVFDWPAHVADVVEQYERRIAEYEQRIAALNLDLMDHRLVVADLTARLRRYEPPTLRISNLPPDPKPSF